MKVRTALLTGLLLIPNLSVAIGTTETCSKDGYTITTINGIFTTEIEAGQNADALTHHIGKTYKGESVNVKYLLNASHLGGLGDILKSVYQGIFDSETINDYDLVEMLKDASEKVRTQKLLLVAHSQGNFYANNFYDTVAGHDGGVPAESIGVYSVATPSGRVAGGGRWLTSDTDRVIAGVVGRALSRPIMEPNTHIVLQPEDDSLGHNFSTVYLKYRGAEIIADIGASLDRLETNTVQDSQEPCLDPPRLTWGHTILGAVFAIADPIATASNATVVALATSIYNTGRTAIAAAASVFYGSSAALEDTEEPIESPIIIDAMAPPAEILSAPAKSSPLPTPSSNQTTTQETPVPNPTISEKPLAGTTPAIADETARSHGNVPDEIIASFRAVSAASSAATTSSAGAAATSSPSSADTDPPSVSLVIARCAESLSPDACLLATTTLAIAWSSDASDLSSYSVSCESSGTACAGFSLSSTTATSTVYAVPSDNTDYIFSAIAKDTNGNESASVSQTVSIAMRPLVINEIAWTGTSAARAEDEWIELYNPTGSSITLDGWNLGSATDNTPYVSLSGSIASKGFFVLERTDDTTISDRAADKIYTGALSNSGEQIILAFGSTTIDQTPEPTSCNNGWCGGSTGTYRTMERIDPLAPDSAADNWTEFAGVPANGKNADGLAIQGTPGKRNSVNYIPPSIASGAHITLTKVKSPYIISGEYTVPQTATLTIEPGVVIKFDTTSSLKINGTLNAHGTSAESIVFTSIKDDDCGIAGGCGDTNAAVTPPASGDWASLWITSSSASSTISHAIIRYGGYMDPQGNYSANVRIENSTTAVTNSVIEHSKIYGIRIENATGGTITSNTIRDNDSAGQTQGAGVYMIASSPLITDNQFIGNNKGLAAYSSDAPEIKRNSFSQNIGEAMEINGSYPILSENTASQNGVNGIMLKLVQDRDYTLSADLPYYVIEDNTVQAGATLTIRAGTILKFDPLATFTVRGALTAEGTASDNVVFTSFNDDAHGGDTNGDGSATAPAAGDWKNTAFTQNLATSTLSYILIRYGGSIGFLDPQGVLRATHASIALDHATIENNYYRGIALEYSTSTVISNSIIRGHNAPNGFGLSLENGSTPTISTTAFSDNETHIYNDGASSYTDGGGNVFD